MQSVSPSHIMLCALRAVSLLHSLSYFAVCILCGFSFHEFMRRVCCVPVEQKFLLTPNSICLWPCYCDCSSIKKEGFSPHRWLPLNPFQRFCDAGYICFILCLGDQLSVIYIIPLELALYFLKTFWNHLRICIYSTIQHLPSSWAHKTLLNWKRVAKKILYICEYLAGIHVFRYISMDMSVHGTCMWCMRNYEPFFIQVCCVLYSRACG